MKIELIHSRGTEKIEMKLASCRMVAMSQADITLVNNYADLETMLLRQDYHTLHVLTKQSVY